MKTDKFNNNEKQVLKRRILRKLQGGILSAPLVRLQKISGIWGSAPLSFVTEQCKLYRTKEPKLSLPLLQWQCSLTLNECAFFFFLTWNMLACCEVFMEKGTGSYSLSRACWDKLNSRIKLTLAIITRWKLLCAFPTSISPRVFPVDLQADHLGKKIAQNKHWEFSRRWMTTVGSSSKTSISRGFYVVEMMPPLIWLQQMGVQAGEKVE